MKKKGLKLLALLLTLVMLFSLVVPVSAYQFPDVSPNIPNITYEFFNAINYAYDNKIMDGVNNTTNNTLEFQPGTSVTRAAVVTVLYKYSKDTGGPYSNPFTDVPASSWYTQAVGWAYANNIMNGVTSTTFAPTRVITREAMMTALHRYADRYLDIPVSAPDIINNCGDYNNISTFARSAMNWAVHVGLLRPGTSTENLYPQAYETRRWLALYMSRFSTCVLKIAPSDRYEFINNAGNFTCGNTRDFYSMTIGDLNKLWNYIDTNYGATGDTYKADVYEAAYLDWTGSCLGMATTVCLDKLGILAINELRQGGGRGTTLLDFSAGSIPPQNDLISAINYYQLLRNVGQFSTHAKSGTEMEEDLAILVTTVQKNNPAVFSFWYNSGDRTPGHAIVVYGYEQLHGKHIINVYDPNLPDYTGVLVVEPDFQSCNYSTGDGNRTYYPVYCYSRTSFSLYNSFDLDGAYNNQSSPLSWADWEDYNPNGNRDNSSPNEILTVSPELIPQNLTDDLGPVPTLREQGYTDPYTQGQMAITIPFDSTLTLSDAAGNTLTFSHGVYSGTMTVHQTAATPTEYSYYTLYVTESPYFIVTPADTFCDVKLMGANVYTHVSGTGITTAKLFQENRVELEGPTVTASISGLLDTEGYILTKLSGTFTNQAEFSFHDTGVIVDSMNPNWDISLGHLTSGQWHTDRITNTPAHANIEVQSAQTGTSINGYITATQIS